MLVTEKLSQNWVVFSWPNTAADKTAVTSALYFGLDTKATWFYTCNNSDSLLLFHQNPLMGSCENLNLTQDKARKVYKVNC